MPDVRDSFGLVGAVLDDKYRVDAVVGEGGFGVVYRGVHEGFDAPIAIKCLKLPAHFDRAAQDSLIAQLREEGRMLLRLSQRTAGIVQALDIGTHTTKEGARVPFLVLEWLDGRTLAEEFARRKSEGKRMTLDEALRLLEPAARALAVAHSEKVAHRDIKPENLMMVTSGGRPTLKILDFGIAKILEDAASAQEAKTSGAAPMLTPGYAAPEQFEKRRGASGPWSDVFSLAIVFIEMVAGKRAIPGGAFMDVYHATVDPDARPSLRGLAIDAPVAVEQVLLKAVHVEPASRFPDAGKFWDALERAVGESPAEVEPPSDAAEDASLPTGEYVVKLAEKTNRGRATAGRGTGRSAEPDVATAATERATTRGPLIAPSSTATPATQRRPWGAVGAGAVALVVVGAFALRSRAPQTPQADTSSTPSAIASTAVVSASTSASAAVPVSTNTQVVTLYREATEAWRGGSPESAVSTLESAAALDRGAGAVQLRLALWTFARKPAEARDHYDLASRHAASLGPKDAALLDAASAVMQVPPDHATYERKLSALAEHSGEDAEVWALLAQARFARLQYDESLQAADMALSIDAAHVASWVFRGDALGGKGDSAAQLESYEKCVKQVPRAFECLHKLVNLRASKGECIAMLESAKRLAEIGPKSARAQRLLAIALHSTRADRAAVLEAFGNAWTQSSAKERATAEPRDKAMLAVLDGDFDGALRLIGDWQTAIAKETEQSPHLEPAAVALEILRETGRTADLATTADELRKKMSAWSEPRTSDWTLTLDRYRLFGGKMTADEFATLRTGWSEKVRGKWQTSGRRSDDELEWTLWVTGYGALALDEASAKAAVAQMPARASVLLSSGRYSSVDVVVGRAYALAGQFAEAKVPLERALGNCSFELADATLATAGWYYLAMAREGLGDKAGAKTAYDKILGRWGKSKAESVTARAAKARLDKMGP